MRPPRKKIMHVNKVLLVEYRDEVVARVAADLTAAGLQVERAVCASKICAGFPAEMLFVNVDLPDGGGWLLAAKLRLRFSMPQIWLYAAWPSPDAVAMAEHVRADGMIEYEGDLGRLSTAIVSRVSVRPAARLSA